MPYANVNLSAASVFAANTIIRSAVGAAFPLFSKQMFRNLGVQWAGNSSWMSCPHHGSYSSGIYQMGTFFAEEIEIRSGL